jgi:hypothetical protein
MKYRTLKSMAKNLELADENEAAQYIYDSRINGNHSQAKTLFQGLSRSEQSEVIYALQGYVEPTDILNAVTHWNS